MYRILEGDVMEMLRTMDSASVDSIVTDPPYELGFMGKSWDTSGIGSSVPMWREALRVLKPGAHLLAFGGSRTYHRMACAIEDAGFEIRDQIMWIYGSGFPKSLDVSKAIDKAARGVPQGGADPTSPNHGNFKGGCSEENPEGRGFGAGPGQFMRKDGRKIIGTRKKRGAFGGVLPAQDAWTLAQANQPLELPITLPATDASKLWQGWGTALKPAHEPIVVARKPLMGTVAANVLEHGTGALNIDGCRVQGDVPTCTQGQSANAGTIYGADQRDQREFIPSTLGRWPANVIHDGSDEVVSLFPQTASGAMKAGTMRAAQDEPGSVCYGTYGGNATDVDTYADAGSAARFFYKVRTGEPAAERTYADKGATNFAMKPGPRRETQDSPARFYYCAKADREERNKGCEELDKKPLVWSAGTLAPGTFQAEGTDRSAQNNHPTVKPIDLMAYLCRLVTPPRGTILDLFMGSGSTGIAALREGFNFIGIEINPAYVEIARLRIDADAPLFNKAADGERVMVDGTEEKPMTSHYPLFPELEA